MANCHLSFFFDAGQPGTLVIDLEGENAVLIGCCEGRGVRCAVRRGGGGNERKTVER